jgi:hypothetical protein
MKTCSKCGVSKPLTEFNKHPHTRDRRQSRCRECGAKQARKWQEDNREAKRAHDRRYTDRREAHARRQRAQRKRMEAIRARRRWRRRQRRRLQRRRNARAKAIWRQRQRRKNDRQWAREQNRAAWRRRRAKMMNAPRGDPRLAREFIAILRGGHCELCGGPVEHIDHIQPLAERGEDGWSNYAGLCGRCNLAKGAQPLLFAILSGWQREADLSASARRAQAAPCASSRTAGHREGPTAENRASRSMGTPAARRGRASGAVVGVNSHFRAKSAA